MPSSVIQSYHYKSQSKSLVIVFVSGISYMYENVPEEVFEKFKSSSSKGIFFNKYIKGNYRYKRMDE